MNNDSVSNSGNDAIADEELELEAARVRYDLERGKRLRSDGSDQYITINADFSHYVDDPHSDPSFTRPPLDDAVEVAIIGGGFAGLIMGARLRLAGFTDIRIIEKASDVGGVWYWNRYPGVQCDIDSYVYLPLLEETDYLPTEKYAHGPEIFEHAQRIARKFDLYESACLQTVVTELRWLEDERKWLVSTDRGDRIRASFVIQTNGAFSKPKLPGIEGIGSYRGHTFHTSRWDYGYTGGDTHGGLTGLADKRVGVIGTGATAIQCVPHLARHAQHLYVFQRTPSSVDLRGNSPTDPQMAASLKPGWQHERRRNFVSLTSGGTEPIDLVNDGWTETARTIGGATWKRTDDRMSPEELSRITELADLRKMNAIRRRVDDIVTDGTTAEALKPWYRQFCKRPTFSDEYLPVFNRDNVTLVDTDGRGVDRFTETGVVVKGHEYAVDCVIFATGFEVGTARIPRASHETYGRRGMTLTEHWAGGRRTLHGLFSSNFPNLFQMGISQNALSYALTATLEDQAGHITAVLTAVRASGRSVVEPTAAAEDEWLAVIRKRNPVAVAFQEACTPGYYNNEGKPGEGGFASELYTGGPLKFAELLAQWRDRGMAGLVIE